MRLLVVALLNAALLLVSTGASSQGQETKKPTAPVIGSRPQTTRLGGRVASVDAEAARIVVRDHRGVRRPFDVGLHARGTLRTLSIGNKVILTWLKEDARRTVVHIEAFPY